MSLNLAILAQTFDEERNWVRDLRSVLEEVGETFQETPLDEGHLIFIDAQVTGLNELLATIDRKRKAVFLIVHEKDATPEALLNGSVDDVLVFPFRPLEVQSKLRHYEHILLWDEVKSLNTSFSEIIESLKSDLQLAERLQKSKLPVRFPQIKGFRLANRYMAGMRSGGDHFDLAESTDRAQLSMVLSDSSSYGLSSAVLSVLMRVAMKLTFEEARSCADTVHRILDELRLALGEKDKLSLFYGVVSRRDFKLRFVNIGTSCALHAKKGGEFQLLPSNGMAITSSLIAALAPTQLEELGMTLEPDDRLALISDGFVEMVGGIEPLKKILNELRAKEAVDSVNELVYRVKATFTDPDDMAAQDCTAVIFDVDAKMLRLA